MVWLLQSDQIFSISAVNLFNLKVYFFQLFTVLPFTYRSYIMLLHKFFLIDIFLCLQLAEIEQLIEVVFFPQNHLIPFVMHLDPHVVTFFGKLLSYCAVMLHENIKWLDQFSNRGLWCFLYTKCYIFYLYDEVLNRSGHCVYGTILG